MEEKFRVAKGRNNREECLMLDRKQGASRLDEQSSQLSDVALKNEAAATTTALGSTAATVADERKNEHS